MLGASLGGHCRRGWLRVGAAAFKEVWGNPGLGDEVTERFRVWEADLALGTQRHVPLEPPRIDPVSKVMDVRRGRRWMLPAAALGAAAICSFVPLSVA